MTDRLRAIEDIRTHARNLQRYPFESATMAEAARLAAGILRKIAKELESA